MEQKKDPRKDYRKRSSQYFLIGLVVALSSTLVAFEWRTFELSKTTLPSYPIVDIIEIEPPVRIFTKSAPPKLKPPKVLLPPAPVPEPDPFPNPNPKPGPVVNPIVDPFIDSGFTPEPFVEEVIPTVKWAEKMPQFVGGEEAMLNYLHSNLRYPEIARNMNVEAKVYVQFIVNTDGSISDVEVLREEGFGLDKEAARVIDEMPDWIPGMQGGKKVRVIYIIPINFSLL